ncbi:hypothetical protein PU630_15550 [Microbacterium horticulturae]|uniref:Integral membrane plasmid transfer protein n=1 Tax=Microbacterium horticulturae TaxID=3028316 RepID=A0ABY8BWW0_9MICO|nr:hypothetical protein [Microbacterium sp. KACC 23027]WEG08639.1 hypothetical protein PU630_15550 [Microbacterium sp. KACC 23027]
MAGGAIATRASVLVAAAGLTSGFQFSAPSLIAALLAACAALTGVALLMMRSTTEVPIEQAEESFWNDSPDEARRNLLHWKLGVLRERERALVRRRRVLVVGFVLLAGSIVVDLVISTSQLS